MSWHLADYAIESTVVLLIGLVAARVLKSRSAAMRHSTWAAALGVALLLGPLAFVKPVLRIPIYPSVDAGAVATDAGRANAFSMAAVYARQRSGAAFAPIVGADAGSSDPARTIGSSPAGATAPRATGRVVVAMILGAWLSGTLLLLVQIVRSRIRLGRLRRNATAIADARIHALVDEIGRRLGLKGTVELLSSRALPTSSERCGPRCCFRRQRNRGPKCACVPFSRTSCPTFAGGIR